MPVQHLQCEPFLLTTAIKPSVEIDIEEAPLPVHVVDVKELALFDAWQQHENQVFVVVVVGPALVGRQQLKCVDANHTTEEDLRESSCNERVRGVSRRCEADGAPKSRKVASGYILLDIANIVAYLNSPT